MRNYKAIAGLILMVVCMSIYSGQTSGFPASSPNIVVTMVNQDPDPVEPGKYVDVRFKIENYGSENAEEVNIRINPKYPFSLEPGDEAIKSVGSIHGMQTGDVGAIVKYRLRVDNSAVGGDNGIEVDYQFGKSQWVKVPEFLISVRPLEATLSIISVTSTPEQIKQGETANVKFILKNMEDIIIKDIKLKLDLSGLPFAPVGSSTEKIIDRIDPNKESSIEFRLIADADATSGTKKVPVTIRYKDPTNKNYSISSDIGLLLGSTPDMSIYIDESTITQSGQQGEVTIKFVNKGISDVKLLNLKLKETEEFSLLSSDEVYIGNIDSDDYETADFKIHVKKTDKSQVILPISIEYKDAQNKDYNQDIQLKLKLYSSSQAKEFGMGNGNGNTGIIVTIVIVVVGLVAYIWWRRRKRK